MASLEPESLLKPLREARGKALSVADLMQRARIHPGARTEVKRLLRDLTRDGVLRRNGKRFALSATPETPPPPKPSRSEPPARLRGGGILGTVTLHRDGFGFVARVDRKGDDLFLPVPEARRAMDGDLVRVEIVAGRGGRSAARLIEVVERRRRWLIGAYQDRGAGSFVIPADTRMTGFVPVPRTALARDGEVVKVRLEPGEPMRGEVVERIGAPGDPAAEVLSVAYRVGFSDLFPEDVVAEAAAIPAEVRPEDRAGRRDLTQLRLVTIDGEDARDFDDAVCVQREGDSFRAWVAIADVAHYVRDGRPLDSEARRRGTSVYFPSRVLPMLPEKLSNGICSLNPEVDRLCMVAEFVVDRQGNTRSSELYPGVMRSAARCTYTEVAAVLAGENVPHREFLRGDFGAMAELQSVLTEMRKRRGAIDFDLPEAKVIIDDKGEVVTIEKRPRNRAHRVVEELMLAANEAVARYFEENELPCVYRVHGEPDGEKLEAFAELARSQGIEMPAEASPRALGQLLERLEGHRFQRALNQLLLRSMMQAIYSADNVGHYGLAADAYLHFTSPIRRYPDLIVHRLLKQQWEGRGPSKAPLQEWAALSSERERAAMHAEREVAAYHAARFMRDKVGQRFSGTVSSVTDFGMFVELGQWFVEGLVKLEELGEGWELDESGHSIVEPRSGRSFRVGDPLEVEVTSASPARRQIDLALVIGGEALKSREGAGEGEGERWPRPRKPEKGRGGLAAAVKSRRGVERRGHGHQPGKGGPPARQGQSKGGAHKQGGKRGGGGRGGRSGKGRRGRR